MSSSLALIPARRGSSGVPGKNLRNVAGLSLVEYAIAAARAARSLTTIAVTSDDEAVLQQAEHHGVLALRRPDGMSEEASPVTLAVRHAVGQAGQVTGLSYDAVVLLQPTSPLRKGADIDAALALFFAQGRSVCSACRCDDNHPARMYRLGEREHLRPLMPELSALRRQDLPPVYLRNGAVYVFGPEDAENETIIRTDMAAYIMPRETSINIDSELDLLVLEAYLSAKSWTF